MEKNAMENHNDTEFAQATSGGSRPIMRSINILMTRTIQQRLEDGTPDNRSSAVREATAIVLEAHARGYEWVMVEIAKRVEASSPKARRADEEQGIIWEKAIVWIPETMLREIERLAVPNNMKPSEFLRGVLIFATDSAKN